jgi:hypothetical protein
MYGIKENGNLFFKKSMILLGSIENSAIFASQF